MSMKNPLTPAGIEPATFRFVVQHLNHCATVVPVKYHVIQGNSGGKFNIFGTDSVGHCDLKKLITITCLILNGYRDRAVSVYMQNHCEL